MSRPRLLAAALLVLAACSREQADPDRAGRAAREGRPSQGGTLRVAIAPARLSLHPLQGRNPHQLDLWDGLHPYLVRLESRGARPPEVTLDLARRYVWSRDEATLTYTLRPGRVWDDTTRICAADVAASFEHYLRQGDIAAAFPSLLASVVERDDSTVVFRFRQGTALWKGFEITAQPVLNARWLAGAKGSSLPPRPPLTGDAFEIPAALTGRGLLLRANPLLATGSGPWVRRVVLDPCPGTDARVLRLRLGRADLLMDAPVDRLDALLHGDEGVRVVENGVASVELLACRLEDALLTVRMRQALSLAIDRERIVAELLTVRGRARGGPAAGIVEPEGPPASLDIARLFDPIVPDSLAPPESLLAAHAAEDSLWNEERVCRFDPAAARLLLDQMGYQDLDGDGLRGRPLFGAAPGDSAAIEVPLRLEVLYDRSNLFRERLVSCIEEDLFRVGIDLHPVPLDGTELMERYENGLFQLALLGFTPTSVPDPAPLLASWGRWNRGGYASPEVDGLIRQLEVEEDPELVARRVRQVEARARRDRPYLFLVYRKELDLIGPRVRGIEDGEGRSLLTLCRTAWLADTTLTSVEAAQAEGRRRGL